MRGQYSQVGDQHVHGGYVNLSIYSAYLAIRFEGLSIVPPIGRVLPLLEMFIHLGLNQNA